MPQPSTQTAQNQAEVMSKIMDGAAILLETTAEKKKKIVASGVIKAKIMFPSLCLPMGLEYIIFLSKKYYQIRLGCYFE